MRPLAILIFLTVLASCADRAAEGPAWYERGNADYDSLRAAEDACKEKGGDFQLKPGGDPTHLGDYVCNPKKAS
ncbi:MAG TPA: hypothetical protein VMT68_10260 [Caulobacteraceae bacterium]|nr:hypothetical protein [Caulobacteraceae bacterium]